MFAAFGFILLGFAIGYVLCAALSNNASLDHIHDTARLDLLESRGFSLVRAGDAWGVLNSTPHTIIGGPAETVRDAIDGARLAARE